MVSLSGGIRYGAAARAKAVPVGEPLRSPNAMTNALQRLREGMSAPPAAPQKPEVVAAPPVPKTPAPAVAPCAPPVAPRPMAVAPPGVLMPTKIKLDIKLNPRDLLGLRAGDGLGARLTLRIAAPGGALTADIAAKTLRRAQGTIRENGVDGVFAVVQGELVGACVMGAGLNAQVKTPKVAP
jgi:hypothetical protein